jgi:GNAT superfamily N-acetyltransferase
MSKCICNITSSETNPFGYLQATIGDTCVGKLEYEVDDDHIYLLNIEVIKSFQGKGIGSELLSKFKDLIFESPHINILHVSVFSRVSKKLMHKFFGMPKYAEELTHECLPETTDNDSWDACESLTYIF